MTIRVALTVNNLRGHKPRGVARVARAVAEQLAADPRFETYVIAFMSFERIDVISEHWRLAHYLDKVPLNLADEAPGEAVKLDWRTRIRDYFIYHLTWTLSPPVARAGLKISRALGLYRPARAIYRTIRDKVAFAYEDPRLARLEAEVERLGMISLNRFDVLISFEGYEDLWEWPVETLKCKTILFAHDTIPLRVYEGAASRADQFFRRIGMAVLRADRIACNSMATMRDINDFFPASLGRTFLAHLGHDRARFVAARGLVRRPSSSIRRIIMIGDLDRRKNLQSVLRALPLLVKRRGDLKMEFVIVGNDASRHQFAHLERDAVKSMTVSWTGYQSDDAVARMIAESDVVLIPSLWEGFGIPVLEAMSAGVPVVCSDISSFPEVGGSHAFYCDPYDIESIVDAVIQALDLTGDERDARIAAADAWAEAFCWKRCADAIGSEIIRLVEEASRAPDGSREAVLLSTIG